MIKPMNGRVLIQVKEAAERTVGGIIIPGTAREDRMNEGTVIAVGTPTPGKMSEVKEQDRVIFEGHRGTKTKIDDVDYLLIFEEDILAVIEE